MSDDHDELRDLVRQTRREVERLERSGRGTSADPALVEWMKELRPVTMQGAPAAPGAGVAAPAARTAVAAPAASPPAASPAPGSPAAPPVSVDVAPPPPGPTTPRYALNPAPPADAAAGRSGRALTKLAPPTDDGRDLAGMSRELGALGADAAECRKCGLCETRTKVVFGSGTARFPLMFVGEAPGFNEDQQGLPFVGQAGKLLTDIIAAMGFDRKDVYIANVLKCRPPENRDPLPHEIEACWPWLERQIELIQPRVICTLGKYSAQLLTGAGPKATIGNMRGRVFRFKGVPVVPTYHPAFLLRSPSFKRATWDDVQLARSLYEAAGAGAEETP